MLGFGPGPREAVQAVAGRFDETQALAQEMDDGLVERGSAAALFAIERGGELRRYVANGEVPRVH